MVPGWLPTRSFVFPSAGHQPTMPDGGGTGVPVAVAIGASVFVAVAVLVAVGVWVAVAVAVAVLVASGVLVAVRVAVGVTVPLGVNGTSVYSSALDRVAKETFWPPA